MDDEDEPIPEVAPTEDDQEQKYAGLRMLCVDDEATYIDTYAKYFSKRGFEVDVCSNLKTFERELTQRHHHVVLLDYYLDGDDVDGLVLMQMVEQHDRDASVIIVTGRPSLDDAVVSLRKHVFDYISKPVKINELAKAVDRALEAKGLLRISANELQRKIGDKIRLLRKNKGLTLAQMAERTGLSVGFLSQIELGKNSASVETLYRIARALDTDPGAFFQDG